jgi:tripartite-type tricarboxylate transporter receptor subunit TctC
VPGAEAAGLPGYSSTFWFGLYAPTGTPPAVVSRLHQAALRGLSRPEAKERMAVGGMDAAPSASPAAFEAEIRAEAPVLTRIIRESGAKVE